MATIPQFVIADEGKRLRVAYQRLKTSRRITQDSVAKACGWKNASTFNRLLSGRLALTHDSLTRVAKALGIEPDLISPRLAQLPDNDLGRLCYLPVSVVKSVSRNSWGEPFVSELRLPFHTVDRGAFALIFDTAVVFEPFDSWVAVVEPSVRPGVNDQVIVRIGKGKYALGRVGALEGPDAAMVSLKQGAQESLSLTRCALIAALVRRSQLRDFRACAENRSVLLAASPALASVAVLR